MKYLITGGAGFIGSHLLKLLLSQGHSVVIIDDLSTGTLDNLPEGLVSLGLDPRAPEVSRDPRRPAPEEDGLPSARETNIITSEVNTFIQGSILDTAALSKAFEGVDGCFHLAAVASVQRSIDNWNYCHQVNLTGTINVFLECAKRNIPVVYTSSAAVYGAATNLPLEENEPIKPLSPYAIDKYTCELQAKVFGGLQNLKSCGLRLFNVFGEGQLKGSDYSGVISIFKQLTEEGKELTIFGDGEQSRDFIHVSDVAKAFVAAMNSASQDAPVVNICTGKSITINYLAEVIQEIAGCEGMLYLAPQEGSIKDSLGDPNLAKKLLGFEASVEFKDGLAELFKSFPRA